MTGIRIVDASALLDDALANIRLTKMRQGSGRREAPRAPFRLGQRLTIETMAVDHAAVLDPAEAIPA